MDTITKKRLEDELLNRGGSLIAAPWGVELSELNAKLSQWKPSNKPCEEPCNFSRTSRGRLKREKPDGTKSALILTRTEKVYCVGEHIRIVFSTYDDASTSACIYHLGDNR